MLLREGTSAQDVALIADLLSVPVDARYPTLEFGPQRQKQETIRALHRRLIGLARKQPVLMLFEDAHWADPSSLELLDTTIGLLVDLPILVVVTFRPEFVAPWIGHSGASLVTLNRLNRRLAETLAAQVAAQHFLPKALLDRIVTQTDGIPLFIEELTKAVLQTTDGHDASLIVPATLHASLMARLDRLPAAKQIAQVGAVIGREFSHALLASIISLPKQQLVHGLDELVASGLVFRRGTLNDAIYTFKHALVREAVYSSLLRTVRQQAHGHIADVFLKHSANNPESVAHHLTEAGRTQESVDYWLQAGRRAAARSADHEAISLLRRGLSGLRTLPEGQQRDRKELEFYIDLGLPVVSTDGYLASSTQETYERAQVLAERLGDVQNLLTATYGRFVVCINRGDNRLANDIALQTTERFVEEQDPSRRMILHRMTGYAAFQAGRLIECRREFDALLALYRPQPDRSFSGGWGHHVQTAVLSYLSNAVWILGYPDQARGMVQEAFDGATRIDHPRSMLQVHNVAGVQFVTLLRDFAALKSRVDAAITFADEHRLQYAGGRLQFFHGLALFEHGIHDHGLALLEGSFPDLSHRPRERGTLFLCLLANAYARSGQVDHASTIIASALAMVDRTGEHIWEAEIHRIAGEILLAQGASAVAVENELQLAIEIAHRQNAKSFQLRATMTLAQILSDQGRCTEAHDLLAHIYAWFTEGFDTPDLRDARALLMALGET